MRGMHGGARSGRRAAAKAGQVKFFRLGQPFAQPCNGNRLRRPGHRATQSAVRTVHGRPLRRPELLREISNRMAFLLPAGPGLGRLGGECGECQSVHRESRRSDRRRCRRRVPVRLRNMDGRRRRLLQPQDDPASVRRSISATSGRLPKITEQSYCSIITESPVGTRCVSPDTSWKTWIRTLRWWTSDRIRHLPNPARCHGCISESDTSSPVRPGAEQPLPRSGLRSEPRASARGFC
jgi:hypothetical protein